MVWVFLGEGRVEVWCPLHHAMEVCLVFVNVDCRLDLKGESEIYMDAIP